MLTYTFSKTEGISLYQQLYQHIKGDILAGRLAAGEKLPSKRMLADHLEISVITVKNAYEQLLAEGYIYSVEKRGYYVSRVEQPLRGQEGHALPATEEEPRYVLDLVTNSISAEYFPFTVWARLMRQTILEQDKGLLWRKSNNENRAFISVCVGWVDSLRSKVSSSKTADVCK